MATSGRFIWHELATSDVKRSAGFYAELFGWTVKEQPMESMTYTLLLKGEIQAGGIAPLPAGAEEMPPHWRMYCTVPDVDAAVKKAAHLGGKVVAPPMDIPTIGRFAAVADPQGAVLMPFVPSGAQGAMPELDPPPPGTFCWDELMTSDPAKAVEFYKAIYGWTVEEQDLGAHKYFVLKRDGRMTGGIMKAPMPGIPTYWGTYVAVESVEQTAKRAESLKAQVIVPPSDIPNMGRFATFRDPIGAFISVFQGS